MCRAFQLRTILTLPLRDVSQWDTIDLIKWLSCNNYEEFHKSFYNNGFTGKDIFRIDVMSFPKVMATTESRCRELQQSIALLQKKPPIIIKGALEQPYVQQGQFGQSYSQVMPGTFRPSLPTRSADPSPPHSRAMSSTDLLASLTISPPGYSGDSVISGESADLPPPPPARSSTFSVQRPPAEQSRLPSGNVQQPRQSYSSTTQRPRLQAAPSTPPPLESMT